MSDDKQNEMMAPCQEEVWLSAYLDGELHEASSRERLDRHLTGCDRCRRKLAVMRSTDQWVRRLPLESAPDGLAERILVQASARARRQVASTGFVLRLLAREVHTVLGLVPVLMMLVVIMVGIQDLQAATRELAVVPMREQLWRVDLATEMYHRAYGRYPVSLKELQSDEIWRGMRLALGGRPIRPLGSIDDTSGKPLMYRVSRDGHRYMMYAPGLNGIDEEGGGDDLHP